MEIVAWQVGIFLAILSATVIFGMMGWMLSILVAVAWTVVEMFTSWLMVLQLITVFASAMFSAVALDGIKSFDRQNHGHVARDLSLTVLAFLGIAAAGGAYFVYKFHPRYLQLDGYAVGLATAYATVLLVSAAIGGAAAWLMAGIWLRDWSVNGAQFGGTVSAIGMAVVMSYGHDAVQRFLEENYGLTDSPAGEISPGSAHAKPATRMQTAPWQPSSERYGALVSKYESTYPAYDPGSAKYDAGAVRETLNRKAYYIFVDRLSDAEALQLAVKDMLSPATRRSSIQVESGSGGRCRYYGRGNRQLVAIDGPCPAIDPSVGLRQQ